MLGYGRRNPYTEAGVRRLPCARCGDPAECQWAICADGNLWRPLCPKCDIALNALVLDFLRDANAAAKIEAYRQRRESEP
jgi:hypothetical protein